MSIDIRLPNITGRTETEQLVQIKSYLYQFAEQLQWAFKTVESGSSSNIVLQKGSSGTTATKEESSPAFNELKSLIIKTAHIAEAYSEKVDNLIDLSGSYVAISDLGVFEEKTKNYVDATDKQLRQDLVDRQTIYDENGKIRAELLVNGHIYSGIIEYAKDGEAIVGIEIGQTTKKDGEDVFNKFARFTAEKLSFYDATMQDEAVAYISNYKMYITNAEVTGTLKLGGFTLDTSNGLALRWEGGS
jgi:hypothetical protein